MSKKKIPIRKCVVTNERLPKNEMYRVVRTEDKSVIVDPTGKARGRGAYLSKKLDVIALARKKNILSRHLEVNVPDEIYDELEKLTGDSIE